MIVLGVIMIIMGMIVTMAAGRVGGLSL